MIEKSIIHVGVPKTGTTAVQAALASSRESLIAAGVLFPVAGSLTREDGSMNHHPLATAIQGCTHPRSMRSPAERTIDAFQAETNESGAHTLLVSSETLSWELLQGQSVARLKQLLPGDDHVVITYVRAIVDLAERMYMQDLLYNGNTLDPIAWLDANFARLDLAATVRRWVSVFGPDQMRVVVYDTSGDSVASFCRVTGLDLERPDSRSRRLNWGVHLYIAPLLREVNRRGIASREISLALHSAANATQPPPGDFRLFTEASLEPLLASLRKDHKPTFWSESTFDAISSVPSGYLDRMLLEEVSASEIAIFTRDLIQNMVVEDDKLDATQCAHPPPRTSATRAMLDMVVHQVALETERNALINDRDVLVAHTQALETERDALINDRDVLVAHTQALETERNAQRRMDRRTLPRRWLIHLLRRFVRAGKITVIPTAFPQEFRTHVVAAARQDEAPQSNLVMDVGIPLVDDPAADQMIAPRPETLSEAHRDRMFTNPSSTGSVAEWSGYEASLLEAGDPEAAWRIRTELTGACQTAVEFGFDEGIRSQSDDASPGSPRRCVILVNHLSEPPTPDDQWHTRHFRLTQSSHFALVAGLLSECRCLGFRPIMIDLRHPFPSALWPERRVLRRDPRVRPTGHVIDQYRSALAEFSVPLADADLRVMDVPTRNESVAEVGERVGHEIGRLGLVKDDVVFVVSGVYSPYLVEPLIARLGSRNFLYCMALGNVSDYARSYHAVLNPFPSAANSGERVLMRPTIRVEPGLRNDSDSKKHALWRELDAIGPSAPVIVCSGRDIVSQWDPEYAELLARLSEQSAVTVVAIGSTPKSAMDRASALRLLDRPIRVHALTWSEDLRITFDLLSRWNAVFLNPRVQGNGLSVVWAAAQGIPVLLFHGNDAQSWIPPRFVSADSVTLARLARDLWGDTAAHATAVAEQCDHTKRMDEINRSLLRNMLT